MIKKEKVITIRADAELKSALYAAAELAGRKYTDQARWLLRIGLGLVKDEAPRGSVDRPGDRVPAVALPTDPALLRGLDPEEREMMQRTLRLFRTAGPEIRRRLLSRLDYTESKVGKRAARPHAQNKKAVA